MSEEVDDKDFIYDVYLKLIINSNIRRDNQKSLKYARLSLKYSDESNKAHSLFEIADAYYWMNDSDKALSYYNETIEEFRKNSKNKKLLRYSYDYIVSFMRKGDIMTDRAHYQEALDIYNKGLSELDSYRTHIDDHSYDNLKTLLNESMKICYSRLAGY